MPKYWVEDVNGTKVLHEYEDGGVDDPVVPGASSAAAALEAHQADALLHSSGQELAYAENVTGTVQVMTATATDVPGCVIVVPASVKPVWVEAYGIFDITSSPAASTTGTLQLSVMDESNAFVASAIASVEAGNTNGFFTVFARARLGPVASPKTLRVQANRGGSTFAATLGNGAIAPVFKTWIAAIAS